ncbi:DSBA-like thioredoxin domain protein [Colletotrichum tofieldiae]|nr:DSBA-like thioredoxin domain protein [Colletotrichum tofieldiae]
MTVFEVDIVFDFVCAWCYIGKRKLDRAIALYQKTYPGGKNDVFSITWRPYYLDYNPSTHSIDKKLLAETKLSDMSPERRAALTQRMEQIGRSVGINFKWEARSGPTPVMRIILCVSPVPEAPRLRNYWSRSFLKLTMS